MDERGCVTQAEAVGGVFVLRLAGEVDLACREDLAAAIEALVAQPCPACQIDLAQVTFMDSTGLGFLAHAVRVMRRRGGQVRVTGSQACVRRLLDLSGMDKLVSVVG
jgi:anti-sigma B factor antagonist